MPPLVSDLSDISKPAMKGITVMRIQELADHSGPVLRRLGLPRLELCSTGQDREPVFLAYLEQPTKVPSRLRLACLRTARHGLSTAIHLPEVPVELHDRFPERRRLPGLRINGVLEVTLCTKTCTPVLPGHRISRMFLHRLRTYHVNTKPLSEVFAENSIIGTTPSSA